MLKAQNVFKQDFHRHLLGVRYIFIIFFLGVCIDSCAGNFKRRTWTYLCSLHYQLKSATLPQLLVRYGDISFRFWRVTECPRKCPSHNWQMQLQVSIVHLLISFSFCRLLSIFSSECSVTNSYYSVINILTTRKMKRITHFKIRSFWLVYYFPLCKGKTKRWCPN